MRENFTAAIANLKEFEGFRSNDPNDPGGRTVHGISEHYFPEMFPDGREPTWEEAEAFYLRKWIEWGCDTLPFPLDVCHYDASVNPGQTAARTFLMWSSEHADTLRRCTEYLLCREEYYVDRVAKRPANLEYICGWIKRNQKMMRRTVINKWDMEVL